jgi:hypothetical protein
MAEESDHMDDQQLRRTSENTTIIDWFSAVYGIFWNVWLGIFAVKVTSDCNLNPSSAVQTISSIIGAEELLSALTVILCGMVGTHAYALVKWLWRMRLVEPNQPFNKVFETVLNFTTAMTVLTIVFIYGFAFVCSVNQRLVIFGGATALFWTFFVSKVVLRSKEDW